MEDGEHWEIVVRLVGDIYTDADQAEAAAAYLRAKFDDNLPLCMDEIMLREISSTRRR